MKNIAIKIGTAIKNEIIKEIKAPGIRHRKEVAEVREIQARFDKNFAEYMKKKEELGLIDKKPRKYNFNLFWFIIQFTPVVGWLVEFNTNSKHTVLINNPIQPIWAIWQLVTTLIFCIWFIFWGGNALYEFSESFK